MTTKGRKPRKARVPFGGARLKMHVDTTDNEKLRNYHVCWVNEPKLEDYRNADYEFVTRDELGMTDIGEQDIGHGNTDLGSKVSRTVGRDVDGRWMRAYLMKLPMAYWKEDQAALEAENSRIDQAINAGTTDGIERGYRKNNHRVTVGSKS